jgi:hypothetical protein
VVRQNYSEAVVADIRVAVLFGLSVWLFLIVISFFVIFCYFVVWDVLCCF